MHQRERQQMRQMAHGGEHFVVLLRGELAHNRSAQFHALRTRATDFLEFSAQRREHHFLALIQIGQCGGAPASFRTSDGMCRDELGKPVTRCVRAATTTSPLVLPPS